ncbi:Leucyl/phenylalanyl-tRNA--protein transferase [Granulibacter bethesdensis]|uniref:Leucyl/phenylalanyl-tRNA--protein transferase n=1 Tax=Granulibacter bethesdensis TaxID=364410 RepID=A0AAC9KBC1_9PROT|nr:leucyl/phenylalanyl-tRNA--protein transferase [Granulibacter bethesdensis]APH55272.1 Leucyl/phenylalanyl-tRNA--protein transferase [Granulibacter bethesdensis]APH62859.1 Leucyl/phenylalanyl-tRNA--protein transferase [Granulibacter bethesdensis]
MSRRAFEITPELILQAYRAGLFPMAETREGARLYWLDPEERGILPLDGFHLPRRLLRTVLADRFEVRIDSDFPAVIHACAAPRQGRMDSWINAEIKRLFIDLHQIGHAHSVEAWQDGKLVGGLYGMVLGAVFFGESMFSTVRDASKVALTHLVARLRLGGFRLLDTQFVTTHLTQFGAMEIPREAYRQRLAASVDIRADWIANPPHALLVHAFRELAGKERNDHGT